MPELPEVEFARGCLERWLRGRTIASTAVLSTRSVDGSPSPIERLAGARLEGTTRHGKQLVASFSGGRALRLHLGMTGKLVRAASGVPVRWSRVVLALDDGGCVHLQDMRTFGRLHAGASAVVAAGLSALRLGPDAWESPLAPRAWRKVCAGASRPVKAVLMDQRVVAGLGNIQATEALHFARLHPARAADTIDVAGLGRLAAGIRRTLERTLAMNGGDTIAYVEESGAPNPFVVYGRRGEPCPACARPIEAVTIDGRTSAFCPRCQPLGRSAK